MTPRLAAGRLDWRAGAALLGGCLWAGMLALSGKFPVSGMALLWLEALSVLLLMRALASGADRATVTLIFALALPLFTAEALLAQSTDQWGHARFDVPLYDLQARALVMHWDGLEVSAREFKLKGLLSLGIPVWQPDDARPYSDVLGMGRHLYQLYIAGVYAVTGHSTATAIFGNLPLAAGGAAGTFMLARALFQSQRVAGLAAGLIVADPGLAVWSAILMRDVLIAFLTALALLGSVRLLRREKPWLNGPLTAGTLAVLVLVRFNVVVALALAGLAVALSGWRAMVWRRAMYAAVGIGVVIFGLAQIAPGLVQSWENSLPGHVVEENLRILAGANRVVESATGAALSEPTEKIDAVRRDWHADLRRQPLWLNLTRATARSLMGPFPWVALTHGLSGTNYYELLFPGMTLWLLCLPAFFYALWRVPVRDDPAVLLCLVWLGTVAMFYIIGYGQLDGRNRLMAQPLLWTFAAQGILWLREKWPSPTHRRVG
ncbi:hypothetical protein [Methylomagnum sp.]